jgi:protease I
MKALIISADGFEDSELRVPLQGLKGAGVAVEVAAVHGGPIRGKHGDEVDVDQLLDEIHAEDYDLLILPGGKAPAELREQPSALAIARAFMAANKPVAAICHGPQILVSAGVLRGRRATCYPAIADELRAAGAFYEDREVVCDGNLITARRPADLPAFMRAIFEQLRAWLPAGERTS